MSPLPLPSKSATTPTHLAGSAKAQGRGSSVFHSPDPNVGPQTAAEILGNPDWMADWIAESTEGSVAVKLFGGEGQMNTGANWFTELRPEDLEIEGLDSRREGSEYPMVRISPADLKQLDNDDIGGKFRVSDEAVRAGITNVIADGLALMTKGITDRLDTMSIAALDAAATSTSHGTMAVPSWLGTQLAGANPTPASNTPAASIIRARTAMRLNGLLSWGDKLLMSPNDDAALRIGYGAEYSALLEGLGITPVVSPLCPDDRAYLIGTPNLGGVVSKQGLTVETWRDPSIRSHWVQTFLEPAIYISRPANVIRLDGIATGPNPNEETAA